MLRVKTVIIAVIGAVVALVFLPLWFGVPVAVLLALWAAGMTVFGSSVVINPEAGLLVFGMGLITRRVRLTDITAVLVDRSKVSVARSAGGEISLYAWRKSALDGWLRVPAEADEIGHAISAAVALAQDAPAPRADADAARPAAGAGRLGRQDPVDARHRPARLRRAGRPGRRAGWSGSAGTTTR